MSAADAGQGLAATRGVLGSSAAEPSAAAAAAAGGGRAAAPPAASACFLRGADAEGT